MVPFPRSQRHWLGLPWLSSVNLTMRGEHPLTGVALNCAATCAFVAKLAVNKANRINALKNLPAFMDNWLLFL